MTSHARISPGAVRHSELFENVRRCGVVRVGVRADAMQAQAIEAIRQHRPRRLRCELNPRTRGRGYVADVSLRSVRSLTRTPQLPINFSLSAGSVIAS